MVILAFVAVVYSECPLAAFTQLGENCEAWMVPTLGVRVT
jgi:hypothetical protein